MNGTGEGAPNHPTADTDSLVIAPEARTGMVAHAYRCFPEEMCGLIAGVPGSERVEHFYPCRNDAASAKLYTINPTDYLRAERDAESHGWEIIGCVHSHTHTEPYPSPTDVAAAPDPTWAYVIVSLKRDAPEIRGYRIRDTVRGDAGDAAGDDPGRPYHDVISEIGLSVR